MNLLGAAGVFKYRSVWQMANAFLLCDESGVENRPAKFLATNLLRAWP